MLQSLSSNLVELISKNHLNTQSHESYSSIGDGTEAFAAVEENVRQHEEHRQHQAAQRENGDAFQTESQQRQTQKAQLQQHDGNNDAADGRLVDALADF